jgi:hypothetical protein
MTPCCEAHAHMDICLTCRDVIDADETRYYGYRRLAKQTFWSPAEYDCAGPFCITCWDRQIEAAAQDEERRSLKGYDPQDVAENF